MKIHSDAGITGWRYSSFGMSRGGPKSVATIVNEELRPALLGQDPFFSKKVRADLWKATEYYGVRGVAQFAMAAVDIALWDTCGKALDVPVYRMLGAFHQAIPACAIVGWYYETEDEYKRAIAAAVEEGFKAVKIKVGRGSLDDDVRRIELAKQLLGKDKPVMVDANQAFANNVPEALRRGRAYQQLGAFWYEEPLPPYEKEGYAKLATTLDLDIATGENLYIRNTSFWTTWSAKPWTSCNLTIAAPAASQNGWKSPHLPMPSACAWPAMAAEQRMSTCFAPCPTPFIWKPEA